MVNRNNNCCKLFNKWLIFRKKKLLNDLNFCEAN